MAYANRHLIDTYTGLFEGLSFLSKIELIESLSKSLKVEQTSVDDKFYQSFGAFASDKSAEEITAEIKLSRKFREKDLLF